MKTYAYFLDTRWEVCEQPLMGTHTSQSPKDGVVSIVPGGSKAT